MPTIFTKIINREIPANIVWEDHDLICFLDIQPMKKGQLLLVLKMEVDKVYDLEDQIYFKLFATAKIIAKKMEESLQSEKSGMQVVRIGYVVEGLEVPHVHIKLVPLAKGGDLSPENIYKASPEELAEMREFYTEVFKSL